MAFCPPFGPPPPYPYAITMPQAPFYTPPDQNAKLYYAPADPKTYGTTKYRYYTASGDVPLMGETPGSRQQSQPPPQPFPMYAAVPPFTATQYGACPFSVPGPQVPTMPGPPPRVGTRMFVYFNEDFVQAGSQSGDSVQFPSHLSFEQSLRKEIFPETCKVADVIHRIGSTCRPDTRRPSRDGIGICQLYTVCDDPARRAFQLGSKIYITDAKAQSTIAECFGSGDEPIWVVRLPFCTRTQDLYYLV